jgi:photosystem II stability/assembly factor-like uncharacterized protein
MSPTIRLFAVLGTIFLSLAFPVAAVEYRAAPIVPLARRALLLDICTAAGRLVVAGEHGIILYSDDDGKNWQQARVPTSRMLTGVSFADAQNGWAVGHDGLILFSDDGGESWRIQRDGLAVQRQTNLERRKAAQRELAALQRQLETADEEHRAELEPALEDARFDLEDANTALDEPVFTSPLMDVWFQDTGRGWAVGAFGTFVDTVDGGQHWASRADELDNPDGFHLNAITGDGRGRVFIAGESGVMFRSLDGGRHWEPLESIYTGSWFGAAYEKQNDSLFVFGLRGNLYRSTDFGATWQRVPNDSSASLAGGNASPDGKVVIAGGVGTLLLSTDGGASFQRTTLADRLGLTSGLLKDDKLIVTGQGGLRVMEAPRHAR